MCCCPVWDALAKAPAVHAEAGVVASPSRCGPARGGLSPCQRGCPGLVHPRWAGCRAIAAAGMAALECAVPHQAAHGCVRARQGNVRVGAQGAGADLGAWCRNTVRPWGRCRHKGGGRRRTPTGVASPGLLTAECSSASSGCADRSRRHRARRRQGWWPATWDAANSASAVELETTHTADTERNLYSLAAQASRLSAGCATTLGSTPRRSGTTSPPCAPQPPLAMH